MVKKIEKVEIVEGEQTPYEKEVKHNEFEYTERIKLIEPWLWSIRNAVVTTGIDYTILMQIIRALTMIGIGSKYGEITIKIENNIVTFVHGQESIRINLPIFLKDTGKDKFSI